MDQKFEIGEREGIEPVDGAYYVRHDTFKVYTGPDIEWYDNKRGLLKFKTHEDRLRHILAVYKVPKDWVDKICEANPCYKWNLVDSDMIVWCYRRTNMPLSMVLERLKN